MPYKKGRRPSRAKPGAKRGRPPGSSPAIVAAGAEALARLASGEAATAAEAAEGLPVAPRTVARLRLKAPVAPPLSPTPSTGPAAVTPPPVEPPAAPSAGPGLLKAPAPPLPQDGEQTSRVLPPGTPVDRLRAYAAHDGEALLVLDDLLAEDLAVDATPPLERVRRLIRRTEARALHAKEARFGPLAGVLDRLYARERLLLGPPPAPPDAVQAALAEQTGVVLARIFEHAANPITAAELAAVGATT